MGGMTTPTIRTTRVSAGADTPASIPSAASLTEGGFTRQSALPLTGMSPEGPQRPHPLSLVASARRLTGKKVKGAKAPKRGDTAWQADAESMYDLVGEERFLANVLAGRAAQAKLYVGKLSHTDPLADPEPVEDANIQLLLDNIGKTAAGRAQLVMRHLINLFIAGEGYLVGIPPRLIPSEDEEDDQPVDPYAADPYAVDPADPLGVSLDELVWHMLSVSEVTFKGDDGVELKLPDQGGVAIETTLPEVYLIRAWRAHPMRGWEADSPTRSSLPVLRELVGLTMAISGQIDSRLAGAGLLLVPQSAADALKRAMKLAEDSDEDPWTDALIEAMITPISDRSSAAAYVPLVAVVPDDAADKFTHMTFDKNFDKELRPLRDEAIRRLALGQDAPPELLLGVGGMNHWGAWLVREDVVTTHLEPPLALLCDALTTQYLRPALIALGIDEQEASDYVVWYDVSHLIVRPNRGDDAQAIYDKGELSGEALRRENGFDESDAPPAIGEVDPAVDLALQLVAQAPSLMQAPGLPAIVQQIRDVQAGRAATEAAAEEAQAEGDAPADGAPADGPPATDGGAAVPPSLEAAMAGLGELVR